MGIGFGISELAQFEEVLTNDRARANDISAMQINMEAMATSIQELAGSVAKQEKENDDRMNQSSSLEANLQGELEQLRDSILQQRTELTRRSADIAELQTNLEVF